MKHIATCDLVKNSVGPSHQFHEAMVLLNSKTLVTFRETGTYRHLASIGSKQTNWPGVSAVVNLQLIVTLKR